MPLSSLDYLDVLGLRALTVCPVCLVSTVSCHHKNALGRGSSRSGHITELEQSRFSFNIYDKGSFTLAKFFGTFVMKNHTFLPLLLALATLGDVTQIGSFLKLYLHWQSLFWKWSKNSGNSNTATKLALAMLDDMTQNWTNPICVASPKVGTFIAWNCQHFHLQTLPMYTRLNCVVSLKVAKSSKGGINCTTKSRRFLSKKPLSMLILLKWEKNGNSHGQTLADRMSPGPSFQL